MSPVYIAVADPWAALSAISLLLTGVTGYAVYRLSASTTQEKSARYKARENAELLRVEHEGWRSLLDNIREEYETLLRERKGLLGVLDRTRAELSQTQVALSETRAQLAATRVELDTTRSRVTELERLLLK